MKDKYLKKIRQLEELRKKYNDKRDEESYGSPARLSDIRKIYGKKVNNPKGCLNILENIIEAYKIGEYNYTIYDSIFYTIDKKYNNKLRKLLDKERKTKKENEEIKELQKKYENLYKKVSKINRKLIKGIKESKWHLEYLTQQKYLDYLKPIYEKLKKLENN